MRRLYAQVGLLAAMALVLLLGAGILFWPLLVWGPTVWVGVYIGYLVGRMTESARLGHVHIHHVDDEEDLEREQVLSPKDFR